MSEENSALPEGWTNTNIGEAFPKPRVKIKPTEDSKLPFIGMDHIEPGSFDLIGQDYFKNMKSAGSPFSKGDVLYGRLRPYLNKVHNAKFEGVASAEFIVLPATETHNSDFLKYLLHQMRFLRYAQSKSSGDRPRIKYERLSEFEFQLPPLAEQERIVSKIDELFSSIEAGERAIDRARASLRRYRKSVLKAAVTGELTHDWREQNPPEETADELLARILKARFETWEKAELEKLDAKGKPRPQTDKQWEKFRARYKGPVAPDEDILHDLPEGWVNSTGQHLFWWSSGDFLPKKKMIPKTIPVYGGNGINGYHNDANVFHETIVVGRVGVHCGNVHKVKHKSWITDNAIYAIHISNIVNIDFAELALENAELGKSSQGGAQPFVNQKVLNEVIIPFPPIAEQSEIVSRVEEALSKADKVEASLDAQAREANALKQSILKLAFEGRLVPQDPNDEPASELLKQIKANA